MLALHHAVGLQLHHACSLLLGGAIESGEHLAIAVGPHSMGSLGQEAIEAQAKVLAAAIVLVH